MSRTAESGHAIQHKAAERSESPDLEAEHDPAVSRRASRAGVRRAGNEANQGATPEAVGEQQATAVHESHQAVQTALIMGAARLRGYTKRMREMIDGKHDDEAGPYRDLQTMQELWQQKDDELKRLAIMMTSADSPQRHALEASRLYTEVFNFDRSWRAAKAFAERNNEKLIGMIESHHPELEKIFKAAGIDTPSWKGDSHIDERSDNTLRVASIKQNTSAAAEFVESIEMALSAGNTRIVAQDLPMLGSHLQEIAIALSEVDRKTMRAFKRPIVTLRKQALKVFHQIDGGGHRQLASDAFTSAMNAYNSIGTVINGR